MNRNNLLSFALGFGVCMLLGYMHQMLPIATVAGLVIVLLAAGMWCGIADALKAPRVVWRDQPREPIGWTPSEIEEINANRAR